MPTVTVVNWNIQNYGPTKSGVHYGNRDVVRAIAKVVNDVNADIFVLLEVNTTHVATAQQVCDIMRAELREASLNPDTEWRRYVLSPNTGREFYAFFVRDTGMTRPLPIVGPLVGGNVPTILGGAGQAAVTAAQFDAVPTVNLRASHFPLLSPDLQDNYGVIPPWPATRYSPRDFHTTPELAINAYDDIFGGSSPAVVGVVGAWSQVKNIPEQIRTRELELNASVRHYEELDQRGFTSAEYKEMAYDYANQLSGDWSHLINLTGSLVGGRLISDHLPVVWDITIG